MMASPAIGDPTAKGACVCFLSRSSEALEVKYEGLSDTAANMALIKG
jgi:hypothetical protein